MNTESLLLAPVFQYVLSMNTSSEIKKTQVPIIDLFQDGW